MTSDIDVLMPVRDGRFLEPAIDSLLAQTHASFRLLIVDDGTDAATRDRIARYVASDRRVECVAVKGSHGLAATLNFGLSHCDAPLVARADADDVYHPERLARQVGAFEARPELGVLSVNGRRIDETGRVTALLAQPSGAEIVRFRMLFTNPILHPGVMFRRDVVNAVGGYDGAYWTAQDSDLWARLQDRTVIDNLPDRLVDWREHGGSVLATRGAAGEALSLTIPVRLQADYLGQSCDPEDVAAAVATLRSWTILSRDTITRGTSHLARILQVATQREPLEVTRHYRQLAARGMGRQATWLMRERPAEAARLGALSLRWLSGLAIATEEGVAA